MTLFYSYDDSCKKKHFKTHLFDKTHYIYIYSRHFIRVKKCKHGNSTL